jgi:hypothetical protein
VEDQEAGLLFIMLVPLRLVGQESPGWAIVAVREVIQIHQVVGEALVLLDRMVDRQLAVMVELVPLIR